MITRINEANILTKHISCDCKCKFNGKKCNSNQKWNNEQCRYESKYRIKHRVYEKDYVWDSGTCACEINEYLKNYDYMKNIIDGSVSTCDEIINTPETMSINSSNKSITYKMDCYILSPILLVTVLLLNIVIICYYCIKHRQNKEAYYLEKYSLFKVTKFISVLPTFRLMQQSLLRTTSRMKSLDFVLKSL